MSQEEIDRPFVNLSNLTKYIDHDVSILGYVRGSNPEGLSFDLTTSDDQNVKIELTAPLDHPVFGLVEVIGKVKNRQTIIAEDIIQHSTEMESNQTLTIYNKMTALLENVPDMWEYES